MLNKNVFPSLQRRGGRAIKKNDAEGHQSWRGRGGQSSRRVWNDHPVCASKVASQHFLDGAATPPVPGGEFGLTFGFHDILRRSVKLRTSMLLLIIILTAFLFLPAAGAQQPVSQQQPFTIKVDTQLVVETVVVKDKDGKNIEGLT